jgi:hypothetical protein
LLVVGCWLLVVGCCLLVSVLVLVLVLVVISKTALALLWVQTCLDALPRKHPDKSGLT